MTVAIAAKGPASTSGAEKFNEANQGAVAVSGP